jgi:ketol-acid reductoisomerase
VTGTKVLFDEDLDDSPLRLKRIGIIGYGSQGRAQVLNLRDSGFHPIIGVRPGKSFDAAARDGHEVVAVEDACRRCDVIMMLVPDEAQPDVCSRSVFPHARRGTMLGFATGFNIHFGLIKVPDHLRTFLAAPKGPGRVLRERYQAGGGIPALVASLGDDPEALLVALAYAKAIGGGRAGVIRTTFAEEAIADLFGEQSVLAGGMIDLMKAAFDVLVKRGYTPEVAYIECISEVEYMASLISRVGPTKLGEHISSTAFYGGHTRGERIVDEGVRAKLRGILEEIEDGRFVAEFRQYAATGRAAMPSGPEGDALEAARLSLKPGGPRV